MTGRLKGRRKGEELKPGREKNLRKLERIVKDKLQE